MHATDSREFRAAPLGRYVAGRTWILWCTDSTLCGSIVWSRLEEADVGEIFTPFESIYSPAMAPRCGVLTDASRLTGIDGSAFRRLADFIGRQLPGLEQRVSRHAIVRPTGLPGALVAGFYEVLGAPTYPVQVFTDAVEALGWLGRPDAAAIAAEIGALVARAAAEPDELRRLRALLSARLDFSLVTAARAIGVSERSLQRRLERARTSFRAELDAARVRAAQTRLADTDDKITAIALEVGCATPQHFSALFRRITGESPSAWRARQRSVVSA